MELILNREHAMKAVTIAGRFAESVSGLKVLQGAHLSADGGRARLTTTDLSLWCQVDMLARTPEAGTVLVPVRTLGKVLKSLPRSSVTLTNDGDDVTLAAGPSEVRVSGTEADEYPEIDPPVGRLVSMPLHASLVDSVAYAVSKDPSRYTLAGVLVEVGEAGFKLVATDGHRLSRYTAASLPPGSVVDVDLEEPARGIIPARLLVESVRLAGQLGSTATLELYEKAAAVRVNGSVLIWSVLIEGVYPAYEGVIPSEHAGMVTMPKGTFGSAVSRLVALSKGRRVAAGRLVPESGELTLRLEGDAGDGVSAVERLCLFDIEGCVPECRFDLRYLHEALQRLPDTAPVHLKFSDDEGECPLTVESPGRKGLTAVLQPMKK